MIGINSRNAFERAKRSFVDGTTRVTIDRDPAPRYIASGMGAYVTDLDGRRLLDLNGNFSALIHGHAFAPVVDAVTRQLSSGSCFANPTLMEIELAEILCDRVPGIESVRFVNTGSEAVMFAVKAARAYTGRPAIAKIEGAYHGAYDWVEVSQASTPATWGAPERPNAVAGYRGQPTSVLDEVVTIRFNDAEGARRLITENAARLAAIVVDPMPGRAGLIPPDPAFIAAIAEAAAAHGILIIGDEVFNFRQGYEGACARYGLQPDLYTLGKIIGGGMPIGAIAGRREVMSVFDAAGKRPALPQGGTFSANPLSMVAGVASLRALDRAALDRLEAMGDRLRQRMTQSIQAASVPMSLTGAASVSRIHPRPTPPREFREAVTSPAQARVNVELARHFAEAGVLVPLGGTLCLSTPMTDADIDLVAEAFDDFVKTRQNLFQDIAS